MRPGGVRRRLRDQLQPRGPPAVRRARRPAPARTASRCCTTPRRDAFRAQVDVARARAPRCWSTPTTSREAVRLGVEVAGPELGAVRLDSGDLGVLAQRGARPARRPRRDRDPDRRDQRPRRVRDRRARRGARSTATASAPSWSPAAGTRPAASSTSWSPARTTTARMVSVAKKSTDKISIGGRKYALRRRDAPRASPRPRWSASASRRSTTATTGRCWSPLVRDGEVVGREPLDDARARHAGVAGRAAAGGPADVARASRSSRPISRWRADRWPWSPATSSPSPRGRHAR